MSEVRETQGGRNDYLEEVMQRTPGARNDDLKGAEEEVIYVRDNDPEGAIGGAQEGEIDDGKEETESIWQRLKGRPMNQYDNKLRKFNLYVVLIILIIVHLI